MTAKVLILLLGSVIPHLPLSSALRQKEQGIEGYVFRISGNRMPSVGVTLPPPKAVKAFIYIFALTNISQVVKTGPAPFYSAVKTKLIKKLRSDSSGYFSVQLPAGQYSLFTKKDSLFYSNRSDGQNNISPVTVTAGKMTQINFNIDYDALY